MSWSFRSNPSLVVFKRLSRSSNLNYRPRKCLELTSINEANYELVSALPIGIKAMRVRFPKMGFFVSGILQ